MSLTIVTLGIARKFKMVLLLSLGLSTKFQIKARTMEFWSFISNTLVLEQRLVAYFQQSQ